MKSKKSFIDQQIEDLAESEEISLEHATERFKKQVDSMTDIDNLPKQNHLWTDRGLKYTCEDAGHPYHEAWKRRKAVI